MSDLGKVGVGAAAGALGYAGAKQLLGSQRPGGDRPGVGDRGGANDRAREIVSRRVRFLPKDQAPAVGLE